MTLERDIVSITLLQQQFAISTYLKVLRNRLQIRYNSLERFLFVSKFFQKFLLGIHLQILIMLN